MARTYRLVDPADGTSTFEFYDITYIDEQLAAITNNITGIAGDVTVIQNDLVNYALKTDIGNLNTDITNIRADIAAVRQEYKDGDAVEHNYIDTVVSTLYTYVDEHDASVRSDMRTYTDGSISVALTPYATKDYVDNEITWCLNQSKSYTNTYVDQQCSAVLNASRAYADAQDSTTLTTAKNYCDTQNNTTLTTAKNYADAQDIVILANSKAYTDNSIAALNISQYATKTWADDGDKATLNSATAYTDIQIQELNIGQYATMTYTNNQIATAITGLNIGQYATTVYVDAQIADVLNVAKQYSDEKIQAIDFTPYATVTYTDAQIAGALATAKQYADSQDDVRAAEARDTYLALAGGEMSGAIDMNNNSIIDVTDPVNDQDAANKRYVDVHSVTGLYYSATDRTLQLSLGASEHTTTIPQADASTDGLMTMADVATLADIATKVQSLVAGGVWRGTFDTVADMEAEYPNFDVSSTTFTPNDFFYVTSDENHGNSFCEYIVSDTKTIVFSSDVPNTRDIPLATNKSYGITKGTEGVAGKVYVESDGTMSVVGWDAVTEYMQTDTYIKAPEAQTANTKLLVAPATKGDVPSLIDITSLAPAAASMTATGMTYNNNMIDVTFAAAITLPDIYSAQMVLTCTFAGITGNVMLIMNKVGNSTVAVGWLLADPTNPDVPQLRLTFNSWVNQQSTILRLNCAPGISPAPTFTNVSGNIVFNR